eukprot:gene5729-6313_t
MSSFSFLSEEAVGPVEGEASQIEAPSGFDFVSSAHSPAVADHTSAPLEVVPVESRVELGKVASTRNVKKKKKATRVGFGRDEGEAEDPSNADDAHLSAAPAPPTPLAPPVVVESDPPSSLLQSLEAQSVEVHHEIEIEHDLPSLPPPPAPSLPSESMEQAPPLPVAPLESVAEQEHAQQSQFSFLLSHSSPDVPAAPLEEETIVIAPAPVSLPDRPPAAAIAVSISNEEEAEESELRGALPHWIADQLLAMKREHPDVYRLLPLDAIRQHFVASRGALGEVVEGVQSWSSLLLLLLDHRQTLLSLDNLQRRLREEVHRLEEEQMRLASAEQFEEAEALSGQIQSLTKSLEEAEQKYALIVKETEALKGNVARDRQGQLEAMLLSYSSSTSSSSASLTTASAAGGKNASLLLAARERLEQAQEEEERRVKALARKCEMEKAHYDREQQALDQEEAMVEEAIALEVGPAYSLRVSYSSSLRTLQEEIRALELELLKKRQEEARVQQALRQEEEKIELVRSKYDRQNQRLKDRKTDLSAARKEVEKEEEDLNTEALKRSQQFHDLLVGLGAVENHFTTFADRVQSLLSLLTHFTEFYRPLNETLALYLEIPLLLHGESEKLPAAFNAIGSGNGKDPVAGEAEGGYLSLRHQYQQYQQDLQHINDQLAVIDRQYLSFQHDLEEIVRSLARCEEEKKVLAASKRFKEAAQVAQTSRALLTQQTDLEEKAEKARSSQEGLKQKQISLEQLVASTEELARKEEDRWIDSIHEEMKTRYHRLYLLLQESRRLEGGSVVPGAEEVGLGSEVVRTIGHLLTAEMEELLALDEALRAKHPTLPSFHFDTPVVSTSASNMENEQQPIVEEDKAEEQVAVEQIPEEQLAEESHEEQEIPPQETDVPEQEDLNDRDNDVLVVEKAEEDLAKKRQELSDQISFLEDEINNAVEAEDYEKAGELQEQVDELQKELEGIAL